MTPGRGCSRQPLEVNGGVSPWLNAVQHPYVFDSLKRNPHCNLAGTERQKLNTKFECLLFKMHIQHIKYVFFPSLFHQLSINLRYNCKPNTKIMVLLQLSRNYILAHCCRRRSSGRGGLPSMTTLACSAMVDPFTDNPEHCRAAQ